MESAIELPQRAQNHIRETSGYKVLESMIPPEWMIRCVTERDYGVDCYIELVDKQNRLTGEIAFVQMKSTDKIDWRKDNGFKFYEIKKSTTNYLNSFSIPTYLFLVDLSTKEIFFVPVKEYIMEHYEEYTRLRIFPYEFNYNSNFFTAEAFEKSFHRNNQYNQFRNELLYFITNERDYIEFMQEHNYRDCFMQIDPEDMMLFEAMHRNISFLQKYFGTINRLTSIEILYKNGEAKYGDAYEQTLFEGILTDFYVEFKQSVLEIFDIIKKLITEKEDYYWRMGNKYVFDFFFNTDKDTLFTV